VSDELEQIWIRVRRELSASVDEPTYHMWLEPLRLVELSATTATVEASPQACGWVHERFGRLLQSCVERALGRRVTVTVTVTDNPESGAAGRRAPSPGRAPARAAAHGQLGNPRYTFDQFVIGDSNRLAHAAALTVAELPGQAYNPLFLCGPPGVGKTHLMHSIANLLVEHNPGLTLRTATGESFASEFREALGDGLIDSFKNRFRDINVLLVDDVQFLERKAKTEEEFFHTFNSLHEAGAQIVLTSDRPPRDLQALEDRLRERFAAGLVADVHPPDFNTRLAILRKRALQDGIAEANEEVLELIAARVALNVRALEGALIRIVAYGSLTSRPLSATLATEVLDGLYPQAHRPMRSVTEIQDVTCEHFGLSREELLSSARTARITWPRQVAMYLARELTDESLPLIGRRFGGKDHTTVLHAWRRTGEKLAVDSASRHTVESLRQRLEHEQS
jgi:chromosomal replication initiator protein